MSWAKFFGVKLPAENEVLKDAEYGEPGDEKTGSLTVASSIDYGELSTSLALQLRRLAVKSPEHAKTAVVVTRGTTWRVPLGILPVAWTRVEVTGRTCRSDEQSASLFHVRLSNPASETDDGLIRFESKEIDAAGRSAGSISAGDDETAAVCSIAAATTANAESGEFVWDAKVWTPDGVDLVNGGDLFVERDVNRSPA